MIDICIIVGVKLGVVQDAVSEQVVGEDIACPMPFSATELVGEQEAVLAVEIILSTHFHTAHVVAAYAILVYRVVGPGAALTETFYIGVPLAATAAPSTVGREKEIVFLCGVVQADAAHGSGDNLGKWIRHHKGQRSADVQIGNTV